MFKELIVCGLLTFSSVANTPVKTSTGVIGSWNYRDDFLWHLLDTVEGDTTYTFNFDDPSDWKRNCPIYTGSAGANYCGQVSFYLTSSKDSVNIEYGVINELTGSGYTLQETIYRSYDITDLDFPSMFLYSRDLVVLHDELNLIWNCFYTTSDNTYITSYNGYYSFNTNLQVFTNKICILGGVSFGYTSAMGFINEYPTYTKAVDLLVYDFEIDRYDEKVYNLPFYSTEFNGNNILINGKMTKVCYSYMSTIGSFAYVRDTTHDDATFQDLLFSVMDSPIYMITRLLSFELFGINLFVAMTGLLTVCVILVLIRKFF